MPRIKKATDANGSVFYPINISKAVYDTDRNQRLNVTLDALESADAVNNKNALNQAVMLMLANFAGMPLKLNNAEWKYVYTDSEDHVLFGKKQDNTWSWGDDTDDLLDDVLDLYAPDDTLFSDIYRLSVILSLIRLSGDLSEIQNPEWKWVVVDSEDKVLMGIKQDNSWYLGATINEILDCALETYEDAGATHGTFANKPTNPSTGDMYFCEDLGTNGKPLWYNGTNWVDATGVIVTSV